MTKTAADFPVGSTVWYGQVYGFGNYVVGECEVSGHSTHSVVSLTKFYTVSVENVFATELEAVADVCKRLDVYSEKQRLEWSESVARLDAMKARLLELEGK